MMNKVKEYMVVLLLILTSIILLLGVFTHINEYQASLMNLQTAKQRQETVTYMQQTEMLKHEDYVLKSNIERLKLRHWLIQNGIKENEVDKFIEENSK